MQISGMVFLVQGERKFLSSWGEGVLVIKEQLSLVKGRSLNPGFPCLLCVVLLGFNFTFSLEFIPVQENLSFCFPPCAVSLPYSVSFACYPCSKI